MQPSNSLKRYAEEAISKGNNTFLFGSTQYNIGEVLPEKNVSNFFVIKIEDKDHFVYSLRDEVK